MSILSQCKACGAKYNVPDSMAGKKVRCKKCSEIFSVTATLAASRSIPDEPD